MDKQALLGRGVGGQVFCAVLAILPLLCVVADETEAVRSIAGETVVLAGQEPAKLWCHPLFGQVVQVRSSYRHEDARITYVEGRDYYLNRSNGTIRRMLHSRIPDFSTNVLFGADSFDHSRFQGFGNNGFFVYVDYGARSAENWPMQSSQATLLTRSLTRLRQGEVFKIAAFGDSITAGADVPAEFIFWRRWADFLQAKHPKANVTAVNCATGGDSTLQGLQRLPTAVLAQKPDLVLIGFGMNDHNINGVPVVDFEENLKHIIHDIRSGTEAEIILFSAFPPNPRWKFGSHRMEGYAEATRRVAHEAKCAYADVFSNWQAVAAHKKPEDLLANDINHPNEFGHWIYFSVFEALGL